MSASLIFKAPRRQLSVPDLPSVQPFAGPLPGADPILVLVADDERMNRRLVGKYLSIAGIEIVEAANGLEALERLEELGPRIDVVLLDLLMPEMDGETMLGIVRADPRYVRLPVLVCSTLAGVERREALLQAGAADYVPKPWRPRELVARVRNLARLKRGMDHLEDAERVILSLARAVEAKDEATHGHCERLSMFSVELGERLGVDPRMLVALDRGGVLHDIGKVGVPDRILFKNTRLDEWEWNVMRQHTVIGDQMLAPLRALQEVRPIVRSHHERWNGSGYPEGLKGEEIPTAARILMVVDAYDALRSERSYKAALTHRKAASLLREESADGLWDPDILETALVMFEECEPPPEFAW